MTTCLCVLKRHAWSIDWSAPMIASAARRGAVIKAWVNHLAVDESPTPIK